MAGRTVPLDFLATVRARPEAVALRAKDGDTYRTLTYAEYARPRRSAGRRVGRSRRRPRHPGRHAHAQPARIPRRRHRVPARRRHADLDLQLVVGGADPVPRRALPGRGRDRRERASSSTGSLAVRDALPDLRHIVVLDGAPEGTVAWEELLTADPVDLETAAHVAAPDDLVTVIYTSGTTGEPKGVMLDHANICWTIESLRLALPFSTEGFRIVSYLPMAHIAERVTTHYGGVVERLRGHHVSRSPLPRQLSRRDASRSCSSACRAPTRRSTAGSARCSRPIRPRTRSSTVRSRSASRSTPPASRGDTLAPELARAFERGRRGDARGRCASCSVSTRCAWRSPRRRRSRSRSCSSSAALGSAALGDVRALGVVGAGHLGGRARAPRARSGARSPASSFASVTTAR